MSNTYFHVTELVMLNKWFQVVFTDLVVISFLLLTAYAIDISNLIPILGDKEQKTKDNKKQQLKKNPQSFIRCDLANLVNRILDNFVSGG